MAEKRLPYKAFRVSAKAAELLEQLAARGFRSAPKELERLILAEAARQSLGQADEPKKGAKKQ